jgi:hypothetical protein
VCRGFESLLAESELDFDVAYQDSEYERSERGMGDLYSNTKAMILCADSNYIQ